MRVVAEFDGRDSPAYSIQIHDGKMLWKDVSGTYLTPGEAESVARAIATERGCRIRVIERRRGEDEATD